MRSWGERTVGVVPVQRLTDQIGKQQVAEERNQRPDARRDEVAQGCCLKVRLT